MRFFFIYIFSFIFLLFCSLFFDLFEVRTFVKSKIPQDIKELIKENILGNNYKIFRDSVRLNYNQKEFPETQFEQLKLELVDLEIKNVETTTIYNEKMNISKQFSRFYINQYKKKILIVYAKGKIFYLDNRKEIQNNFLNEISGSEILNSLIYEDDLFISYIWSEKNTKNNKDQTNTCKYVKVAKATINTNKLNFKEIYKTNDCIDRKVRVSAGKMIFYKSSYPGILLSTAAQFEFKNLAQDPKSSFGKLILINLENFKSKTFSSGHRNPMGLVNVDGVILETEHGPCGGDEINLINEGRNYGWPLISEGDDYAFCRDFENSKDYKHQKINLDKLNYINPIFSFVPSIGISSIIKIPDSFSPYWKNNYFVASLNGSSLYRIRFDENFKKINFVEKIFIGSRIVDVEYDKNNKQFLLALEESNSLGLLKVDEKKNKPKEQNN